MDGRPITSEKIGRHGILVRAGRRSSRVADLRLVSFVIFASWWLNRATSPRHHHNPAPAQGPARSEGSRHHWSPRRHTTHCSDWERSPLDCGPKEKRPPRSMGWPCRSWMINSYRLGVLYSLPASFMARASLMASFASSRNACYRNQSLPNSNGRFTLRRLLVARATERKTHRGPSWR